MSFIFETNAFSTIIQNTQTYLIDMYSWPSCWSRTNMLGAVIACAYEFLPLMKKVSGVQILSANIQFIENSDRPRSVLLNRSLASYQTCLRYTCIAYSCKGRWKQFILEPKYKQTVGQTKVWWNDTTLLKQVK